MREVIVVCRSTKRARIRVAQILDRYFWRIGDRTWRGKATNACLGSVSRELRKEATRNTAVVIHEIRSARESRVPIIRIGNRQAFSETGIASIASRPTQLARNFTVSNSRSVVQIAALFHDLGKATVLFQNKLQRALKPKGGKPESDAVRHEIYSAAVWDCLFGEELDHALPQALQNLTSEQIDKTCNDIRDTLVSIFETPSKPLPFSFLKHEGRFSHAIGMLILTHHRLPEGDSDLLSPLAERHVNPNAKFSSVRDLAIAPGTPFWHETWWVEKLRENAGHLKPDTTVIGLDMYLRASLMMGDHLGSSQKQHSENMPDHLANTIPEDRCAGDSLSRHVRRVHAASRHGVNLFERYANGFPAIEKGEMPVKIAFPIISENIRFQWQSESAMAARTLCETNEGGFFACLMSGTGTGKTRGAPTILAAAAFADTRQERRYFRMNLGLGLRTLAIQSADEYILDLEFGNQNISVLVGQVPPVFKGNEDLEYKNENGSENLIEIPDWLRVETANREVPKSGDDNEAHWLNTLSLDTGKDLPVFCNKILENSGARASVGRKLLTQPIMIGTIDHLMSVATPLNSRYIIPSIRVATADLIIDEIDQFGGEDIAAIGRLVYQTAVAGRRVIIMSATLTPDIAFALHTAYCHGWSQFAAAHGFADHVNLLVTGDAQGSCRTNMRNETLEELLNTSTDVTLQALDIARPARRAEILPPCNNWKDMISQIDRACHYLHDLNAVDLDGFQVSFGMVRMTRIAHTAALATQLPSGKTGKCLRVMLCLHSQFPCLHRSWIETHLKCALTRKNDNDPNFELRKLCYDENLFGRATKMQTCDIEIVLVTSPVIETGNDLDFDWAVLDPISTRSIIQTAGRVWRHRQIIGNQTNVMVLGKSPVAMQSGKLEMPGVETKIPDDVKIDTPSLSNFKGKNFEGRQFDELTGDADFSVINAIPILQSGINFPLRDMEHDLREKLVTAKHDSAEKPLGRYIRRIVARMTRRIFKVRKFRRSVHKSILLTCVGEDFETAEWHLDLAPGTYQSELVPVNKDKFDTGDTSKIKGCYLFENMTERAWRDRVISQNPVYHDIENLMRIEIPDYNSTSGLEAEPQLTYIEFTGFTRGTFGDLFKPFGKP